MIRKLLIRLTKKSQPSFFDYSARKKKNVLVKAANLACKEQLALIKEYEDKYGCGVAK